MCPAPRPARRGAGGGGARLTRAAARRGQDGGLSEEEFLGMLMGDDEGEEAIQVRDEACPISTG